MRGHDGPCYPYVLTIPHPLLSNHRSQQTIRPNRLRPLFGTSLTDTFLLSLLDTFQTLITSEKVTPAQVRPYITAFSSLERFSFVVMFFGASGKELAREVLEAVGVDRAAWGI